MKVKYIDNSNREFITTGAGFTYGVFDEIVQNQLVVGEVYEVDESYHKSYPTIDYLIWLNGQKTYWIKERFVVVEEKMRKDTFNTLVDLLVDEMYSAYGLSADKKEIEKALKLDLQSNGDRNMSNQEVEDFICDVNDSPETELCKLYPNTYAKLWECF